MSEGLELVSTCRQARPEDASSIREILVESHLSAPIVGDLERATGSPIGEVLTLVCEKNRRLVGVLVWRHLGSEAEILDLAVRPGHRRHGHASSLLKLFLQPNREIESVFLEVRESNAPAIATYQKFGFQVTGRRENYYRNPVEAALLMAVRLST